LLPIDLLTLNPEEPASEKSAKFFVYYENLRVTDLEVRTQTATQSEGLVVWTEPDALDEAKSLFAPYSPRFQTVPYDAMTALTKTQVTVLYLSSVVRLK